MEKHEKHHHTELFMASSHAKSDEDMRGRKRERKKSFKKSKTSWCIFLFCYCCLRVKSVQDRKGKQREPERKSGRFRQQEKDWKPKLF